MLRGMQFEDPQVLVPRLKALTHFRDKEWWYSGVVDQTSDAYVSWYFARVNVIDEFAFTVFDPSLAAPLTFSKKLWLDAGGVPDATRLIGRGSGWHVSYEGSAETGWKLSFSGGGMKAELSLRATRPEFTKFDNELVDDYGLLHFFHIRVDGVVEAGGRTFRIEDGLAYQDHCFGTVPSKTGWHWLAVQSPDVALSSLVNYGIYPQRYTQVWLESLGRWTRLNQDVSFEQPPGFALTDPWAVTSTDMDLLVSPSQAHTSVQKIPPLLPFFVNLRHSELSVKVTGRVRVDGAWVDVGTLRGVMEQHSGRW